MVIIDGDGTETRSQLVRFDWAIKYLLRNKANFDILEGFLTELLKTPISIEQILESEGNQEHAEAKYNRVDILVHTATGQRIIVEVQCTSQWDYLSRILYGTSNVVCEYIRKGDPYRNIGKVISVSIVFFDLGTGKDYLYHGHTTFKGMHYGDQLNLNPQERDFYQSAQLPLTRQTPENVFPEYYILKVTQFQERVQNKLDEWIYFFKHDAVKPEFSAQGLQSAAEKLKILHLSDKERRSYKKYQEGEHDEASFVEMIRVAELKSHKKGLKKGYEQGLERGHEHGIERGIAQGIEQGIEQGLEQGREAGITEGRLAERQQIAKSMKQAGFSEQEITQLTHLTPAEIKSL